MVVGWQFTPGLPSRWLTREFNGQRQFMTDANKIFKSFVEAHQYLTLNKDQFKLEDRKTFYSTFSKKQNTQTKSVKSARGQQQLAGGRRRNDEAFTRLKAIIDKGGDPHQVAAAISELKTFGWYSDPRLPPGWLKFNPIKMPIQYLIFEPYCSRYLNKQAALSGLRSKMGEKRSGVDKEYILRFVLGTSDLEHRLNTEHDLNWEANNSSVPPGWKIRRDGGARDARAVEILSPQNICFKTRLAAFTLMKLPECRDLFEAAEVDLLAGYLEQEGWEDHPLIPSGWKINRTEKISRFLSSDCRVLAGQAAARSYVMEPGSKVSLQERKNFMDAEPSLFLNSTPRALPSLELQQASPESSSVGLVLPPSWRLERLAGELVKITGGAGAVFYSRLQALQHLVESGEEDQELLLGLWESLRLEGWISHLTFVPQGWAVRRTGREVLFLTKELVVLASVEEALEYIETDDEYEPVAYKVLNDWRELFLGATWVEDSILPPGWLKTEVRLETEEEETQSEHFLAPSGEIYSDKVAVIRDMIDQQLPTHHILRIWNSLDTDSWMVDNTQVPLGWKIRFDCELNQDEYLSPRMEVLKSREDIVKLGSSLSTSSDEGDRLMAEYIDKWEKLTV